MHDVARGEGAPARLRGHDEPSVAVDVDGLALDRVSARQVHALLTDGTTVRIRQAGPADHDAVLALYEGMSAENLRRRFFTVSHLSADEAADRLTRRDRSGYRALVAQSGGRLVGLAEYEALPESATAEIALSVADDWHHRGLGTLLLEHLMAAARHVGSQVGAGLKSLVGGELRGQTKMLIESRQQAQQRLEEEAAARGADAILAMRFDATEIGGGWQEICAYGTAVKVRPLA